MSSERVEPIVTIIPPDGRPQPFDRRRGDSIFRPYRPPATVRSEERRRRPRTPGEPVRGRMLDLET